MARRLAVALAGLAVLLVIARFALPLLAPATEAITAEAAAQHIGERAEVCGRVASANHSLESKGRPTFLNFDRPYPDHIFTALIWGKDRARFSAPPESLLGQDVCAHGTITEHKGKPQIIVERPAQLTKPATPAD
ncbi:MAG: hypothetical protein OEP95_01850 [Myxococcales bacterium]|nr:hypothetical protein [Myxococcales bacterium]